MPIDVDLQHAPRCLVYRFSEPVPTVAEQAALRASLVAAGQLTASSRALLDLRALTTRPILEEFDALVPSARRLELWPLWRAYVVGLPAHLSALRQLQDTLPDLEMAAFADEAEARAWLEA